MSAIVEITELNHVILYKFQKMIEGGTPRPVLSFSRLWFITSNAACRMAPQGIPHPISEKKNFSIRFFEQIDFLVRAGLCDRKEEENGTRKQLISLSLTNTGNDYVMRTIFAAQERAQEPEVIWKKPPYRGPIY